MLSFIESWLKNLIVIIILISMVKMVMPTGKIKSYVRFILSLIVMLLIVQPVVDAIKGSDFLVNSWLQRQKVMTFEDNRVYTLAQAISKNDEAIQLYKKTLIEQLERDLSILTDNEIKIDLLKINENMNSKQFGYVSEVSISIVKDQTSMEATEVMANNSQKLGIESDIKKWLTSNYGEESMKIKISLESEG